MLLNISQGTGQPLSTNYPAQIVNSTEVEKPSFSKKETFVQGRLEFSQVVSGERYCQREGFSEQRHIGKKNYFMCRK